jgi:hypothetical protein
MKLCLITVLVATVLAAPTKPSFKEFVQDAIEVIEAGNTQDEGLNLDEVLKKHKIRTVEDLKHGIINDIKSSLEDIEDYIFFEGETQDDIEATIRFLRDLVQCNKEEFREMIYRYGKLLSDKVTAILCRVLKTNKRIMPAMNLEKVLKEEEELIRWENIDVKKVQILLKEALEKRERDLMLKEIIENVDIDELALYARETLKKNSKKADLEEFAEDLRDESEVESVENEEVQMESLQA